MIRSNLDLLRVQKERQEGRRLPYRVIAEETGLSQGVLVRLMSQEFERVDRGSLNTLCGYFGVGVGDVLEYLPDKIVETELPAESKQAAA